MDDDPGKRIADAVDEEVYRTMNDELDHRLSLRRRILDWLFPPQPYISLHHLEALPWMRDLMFQDVSIALSLRDRLRVLVSGRVCVRSVSAVSAEIERTHTETVAWIPPPKSLDR